LAVVTPAGAAVPSKPAKVTVPCGDGQVARLWFTIGDGTLTKLAGDNPCDGWLTFKYGPAYASSAARDMLAVAPGAHFNWGKKRVGLNGVRGPVWGARVVPTWECEGPTTIHLLYSYRDVQVAEDC
jgi:hypothetical protein